MTTSLESPTSNPVDAKETDIKLVDCDVHPNFAADWVVELRDHFTPEWAVKFGAREKYTTRAFPGAAHTLPYNPFYPVPVGVMRGELLGEDGSMPATDAKVAAKQLLDEYDVDRGLLVPANIIGVGSHPNVDVVTEVAAATNHWIVENWLDVDPRYRGAIIIAPQNAARAADEIHKWSGDQRMVGVYFSIGNVLMGDERYFPIYEAAEEAGLAIMLHVTGAEGIFATSPSLPGGTPTVQLDWRAGWPYCYAANIANLVARGVFERFPKLKFVFAEVGFTWLPDLMWRLDTTWRSTRSDVPWVKRPPSEYIIESCRFTTQPLPETETEEQLLQMLAMLHAEETLLFSSDYPHWDWDDPRKSLKRLGQFKERVAFGNALETFGSRLL